MWRHIQSWFTNIITRNDRIENELADELEFHIQMRADQAQSRGLSRSEALRQARIELGNPENIKEDARDVSSGAWGAWIDPLLQDMRYGLRMLCKHPGVTMIGVVSMAVGIGVCTYFFSQFNAMVLRPLPGVRAPHALVASNESFSYPVFERFRDLEAIADAATAYIGPVPFNVAFENGLDPESGGARTFGHLVSPDYFSVLGVTPAAGRFFSPETERIGSEEAVVISDRFWRRRLDADPGAVGRTLRISGGSATIVGIAPDGFRGVFPVRPADIFVPVTAGPSVAPELRGDILQDPEADRFQVVLRLASGVSMSAAEAALDTVARSRDAARTDIDDEMRREGRQVTLLRAGRVGRLTTRELWLVVGLNGLLFGLVLSLACANLAGLLTARAGERRREMALRMAVGAGRGRLIRQLLTESVMLALAGGIAGVIFSYGLVRAAESVTAATATPFEMDLRIDPTVCLFVTVVAVLAGVGIGLVPAFAATSRGVTAILKSGWLAPLRSYRRFGFRNLFVGYQVAVSAMLLLVVGYLVIGFQRFGGIDPGFDTAGLAIFEIDPARDGYPPAQAGVMFEEIPQELSELGAVAAATIADRAPLGNVFGSAAQSDFRVSTGAAAAGGSPAIESVARQHVGSDYFATLGVPVVLGREFTKRDHEQQRASGANETMATPVVVNQTASRRLFGDDAPIGQPLRASDRRYVIVGVVQDSRPSFLTADPVPTVFLPLPDARRDGGPTTATTVLVRGVAGLDSIDTARRELARLHPDLTIFNVRTMNEHLDRFNRMIWFNSSQFGGLGVFGLVLASIGLASVTAYAVARRRKEVAIRLALGAGRSDVLRLVLREGTVLVVAGAMFGCAGAFWLSRLLSSLLVDFARVFAVSAGDPLLLAGVPALLVGITFLFCYFPARRVIRLDPATTLRAE